MKVKDVIVLAAEELGVGEKVKAFLSQGDVSGEATTDALVRCFNLVENEVALDYLPLFAEDVVLTDSGRIAFSAFSENPVRILFVVDSDGNKVKFNLFPDHIRLEKPAVYTVTYTYSPKKKGIDDESDFKTAVSERLFAYGIAAEYCTACGLYEEGAVWAEKYKDALKAAYKQKACRVMRTRRWV